MSSARPRRREDHGEPGTIAAHDEIAAEREGEARTDGDAVDLGDGGLGDPVQAQRDVTEPAHAGQARARAVGGGPVGVRQVCAGAEGAARAGQDHHPVVVAVLDLGEDLLELVQHLVVGGVLALGAVHRDGHDAVLALDNEGLHGHRP